MAIATALSTKDTKDTKRTKSTNRHQNTMHFVKNREYYHFYGNYRIFISGYKKYCH